MQLCERGRTEHYLVVRFQPVAGKDRRSHFGVHAPGQNRHGLAVNLRARKAEAGPPGDVRGMAQESANLGRTFPPVDCSKA